MGSLFSRRNESNTSSSSNETTGTGMSSLLGQTNRESQPSTSSQGDTAPRDGLDLPETVGSSRDDPKPNSSFKMPGVSQQDLNRLRYEMSVRLSEETEFQTFMRKTVKPAWTMVFGPIMDILTLSIRPFDVFFREFLLKTVLFELSDFVLELMFLPEYLRNLHCVPFKEMVLQEYYRFVDTTTIYEDIAQHVKFSLDHAQAVFNGKWSRPSKVYIGSVTLLAAYTLYIKQIRPWPRHDKSTEIDCIHKTVVITGASSGIGNRLAYEFAKRGAFVVITSPDMVKARKARLDLSRRLMGHIEREKARYIDWTKIRYYEQMKIPCKLDVEFILHNMVEMELNLASTASIYSFTRKIQGMSPQGIDILINNAAMHAPPEEMVVTDEGKEAHFAVNYFGHFVLTNLLLGELAKRKGSRIINITCKKEAEKGFINIQKFVRAYLEDEGLPYLPAELGYENSKLAMYLFNRHLSKELWLAGLNHVTTYCVCPGVTRTFINRHMHDTSHFSRFWSEWREPFHKKVFQAVQPILHCALSPKVACESGFFYEDSKRSVLKTRHKDPDRLAESLWTSSKALMGIGHHSMLRLTEQMHIKSHENVFQLGSNLFLHRRDVMTHLLLMEEQATFKNRHKKFVDEKGDAREDFTYFWHGFYLAGGEGSGLLERWVLYNTHPGFRALQREYDIWFECTGSSHYYPGATGKMAPLQFMNSMPDPLTKGDIVELEELYDSDSEPDAEVEHKERFHKDLIPMDEFVE